MARACSARQGPSCRRSRVRFGGTPRVKPVGYCEYQTAVIELRKGWWDLIAPTLPDNPELTGETPPGPPDKDPFVYCEMAAP